MKSKEKLIQLLENFTQQMPSVKLEYWENKSTSSHVIFVSPEKEVKREIFYELEKNIFVKMFNEFPFVSICFTAEKKNIQ